MNRRPIPNIFLGITLGLLAIDQLVKFWVRSSFVLGEARPYPWPGVFELKLTYNEGIAFGIAQGHGTMFAPIALLIAALTTWYAFKPNHQAKSLQTALGLLTAGAIGNLIDRVWMGRVTDMFWIRAINFPVFNIADVCLTFSVVLLFLISMKEQPKPATAPVQPDQTS